MKTKPFWNSVSLLLILVNTILHCKEIVITPQDLEVKVGLALSGGGARGVAQIGVLKVLERANIPIHGIAGTSIGAFVGGLYAIGYSPSEMEEIAINTNWENVLTILKEQERSELFFDQKMIQDRTFATLRFKKFKFVYPQALSLGWKFNSFIQRLVWEGAFYSDNFDNFKVPFRAVSTDVVEGKTISIGKGNLITALRASSTIPLLNTPVSLDSMILVDGGLFANLPVEQVKELNPHIIIGVNTTSPLKDRTELNKPWSLASQIISIFMNKYFEKALQEADIVITPDLGNHPNDNFKGLDSLVSKGEKSALEKLAEIQRLIKSKTDSLTKVTIERITKEFSLGERLFLKRIETDSKNYSFEYYQITETLTSTTLDDFLKSLNKQTIEKVVFKQETNGNVIVEVHKYPKLESIKCNCKIQSLVEKSDSLANLFLNYYDNPSTRLKIVETYRKFFAREGYSFVKIEIAPDFFSKNLTITVEPNKIGKIYIDPKIKTSDYIIRRELALKEGDFTNSEKIVQSWRNIISSGLFSDVFIDFVIDTMQSTCDIFISAIERGTQVLNLLFAINNEKNLQGGADFIHENLFNTGTRFLLNISGCKSDFLTKFNLTQPRIWNTDFSFSFEGFYYYREVPIISSKYTKRTRYETYIEKEFATERYNFNIIAGKQIERLGNLFVGLKFEKQRYYETNATIKPDYYTVNNFIVGLVYDSRDKAEFSTSGRLINLSFESSLFKTTNSTKFSRAIFQHSTNLAFNDFVFRPRILFGFADNGLPFPDFFTLGGEWDFLGFQKDELLGRQIFNGRIEVQYHLPFKIYFDTYLTATYNIGSTWEKFDVIRISELKHGIGISLGFETPIGPVRFSAGQGFYFIKNPNATVWGPLKLYFTIGNRLF